MKIVYTVSGQKAVEDYIDSQTKEFLKKLEGEIVSNKYVLGDDTVEVTAADIKQAVKMLDKPSHSSWLKITLKLYMVLGGATSLAGIFFETFLNTFSVLFNNPIQFILFLFGLVLFFFGYVMLQRIRAREIEQNWKMKKQSSTMNIQNSTVAIYKDQKNILNKDATADTHAKSKTLDEPVPMQHE